MNLNDYLRYRRVFEISAWTLFFALVAASNVVVVLIEFGRRDVQIPLWEPATWEFSSMGVQLLLLPLILFFDAYMPLRWKGLWRGLLWHFLFSIVFSVLHILGMVALRKWVYWLAGSHYNFGNWLVQGPYEYLKDWRAYFIYLALIYLYRFVLLRMQGEVSMLGESDANDGTESATDRIGPRLLVKKLDREFLIMTDNIERIEAAGNYVNLHVEGRVYPLRATMTNIERRLPAPTFVRVHRSHIVNVNFLLELELLDSGDATAQLKSGERIPVSRKYRKNLATTA